MKICNSHPRRSKENRKRKRCDMDRMKNLHIATNGLVVVSPDQPPFKKQKLDLTKRRKPRKRLYQNQRQRKKYTSDLFHSQSQAISFVDQQKYYFQKNLSTFMQRKEHAQQNEEEKRVPAVDSTVPPVHSQWQTLYRIEQQKHYFKKLQDIARHVHGRVESTTADGPIAETSALNCENEMHPDPMTEQEIDMLERQRPMTCGDGTSSADYASSSRADASTGSSGPPRDSFSGKETGNVLTRLKVQRIWTHPASNLPVCYIGKSGVNKFCLTDHHLQTLKFGKLVCGQVISYYFLMLARRRNVLVLHTDLVKYILDDETKPELRAFYWTDMHNIIIVELLKFYGMNLKSFDAIMGTYNKNNNHWNLLMIYPKEEKICLLEPYGSSMEDFEDATAKWSEFCRKHQNESRNFWKPGEKVHHDVQGGHDCKNCGPITMLLGAAMIELLPKVPSHIPFRSTDAGLNDIRLSQALMILDQSDDPYEDSDSENNSASIDGNRLSFAGGLHLDRKAKSRRESQNEEKDGSITKLPVFMVLCKPMKVLSFKGITARRTSSIKRKRRLRSRRSDTSSQQRSRLQWRVLVKRVRRTLASVS